MVYQSTALCSTNIKDAASVWKLQISKNMDDEVINSSHTSQNFSYVAKTESGTKACPAIWRSIKCRNYNSVSEETADSGGIKSTG